MVRKEELIKKIEEDNKKTLREEIVELKEILEQSKEVPKEKKFKGKKVSNAKLKKGYVLVVLMKANNFWDFRLLPVVNGNIFLKENETFHLADTDYVGMWKKYPVVILPEWSNEPLTKEVLTRKIDENKSTIKPQKQIIHLMEDARLAEQMKPKRSAKGIMMLIVIGSIIYLVAKQLGWF